MEPSQWRSKLLEEWRIRQSDIAVLNAYYGGDHPLPNAPAKLIDVTHRLRKLCRLNMCELIVDSVAERINVTGFRFGESTDGDKDAWRIWQANRLDADSALLTSDALALKSSYALVWPNVASPVGVDITIEHPTQCVVWYEAGSMRERAAGLKVWRDETDKRAYCTLYLPDGIYKYVSDQTVQAESTISKSTKWKPRDVLDADGEREPHPLPNPFAPDGSEIGPVPLVEFRPRPKLLGWGRSEITPTVVDIQDRINKTIYDRVVAQEFTAFRQRWATGMEIPEDENGQPKEPFSAAVDRLWISEDSDTEFGEFSETDLSNYTKCIESDVTHLAAISKVPPHYLLGSIVNASGDALKASETGLVKLCRKRMIYLGESWEEVIRLAMRVTSLDGARARADDFGAEVIWQDPEVRSEGETVDALTKMSTLGVPNPVLWQRWGASPQEVLRWRAMQVADAFAALPVGTDIAAPSGNDPVALKAQFDALGVAIRSGVDPAEAARRLGLDGITFTGAIPTSLRPPADQAAQLEQVGGGNGTS